MLNEVVSIARGVRDFFVHPPRVETHQKDGHANFVTNVDIDVQCQLEQALLKLLPGSALIGEEKKNQGLSDRPTWVVDPIDGTTNFLRGRDYSSVSIALLENQRPVLACVYQPFRDEVFTAALNGGAFLNGQRIHVSEIAFERALVGFGTAPYDTSLAESSMKLALRFLQHCADLRRTGSAALDLAEVACGRQDVFFELCLSPWDIAAGALLVQEAGGVFSMPLLEKPQFAQPAAVLASNQRCAAEAWELFCSFMKETAAPGQGGQV